MMRLLQYPCRWEPEKPKIQFVALTDTTKIEVSRPPSFPATSPWREKERALARVWGVGMGDDEPRSRKLRWPPSPTPPPFLLSLWAQAWTEDGAIPETDDGFTVIESNDYHWGAYA